MTAIGLLAAALALLPAVLTLWNLRLFRPPPRAVPPGLAVSVVVPARDEEANIGACLAAILASAGVALEVIVVDDHSTDRTPAIIDAAAAIDPRVRRVVPPALPPGWSGKPHACLHGATSASHAILLFIDADVRLAPDAVARLAAGLRADGLALASAFPRERAETFGEILLVPLIHVLLLGYLPFALMRRSLRPGLGAGCGQVMLADAAAYRAVGGHGAVRRSWHDGLTLPRAFRAQGYMTGVFDGTGIAACRMYEGFAATWRGFSKNAREGLAKPVALPVWTVLLGGGFVAAPLLAVLAPSPPSTGAVLLLLAARIAVAARFRQPWLSVPLTPLAMAATLLLQWRALLRGDARAHIWRGRIQTT